MKKKGKKMHKSNGWKKRKEEGKGRRGARESLGSKEIIHKLEEAPQATSRNDRQGEVIVQGAQI